MIINKAPEAVKRFCEEMLTIINENKDKRSKVMTIKERLQKEEDLAKEIAKAFVETVKTFDWSTIEIAVINKFTCRLEPDATIDFMKIVMDKCGFHNLSAVDFVRHDSLRYRIERAFWMLTNMPDYKEAHLQNYVVSDENEKNCDYPAWTLVFNLSN